MNKTYVTSSYSSKKEEDEKKNEYIIGPDINDLE